MYLLGHVALGYILASMAARWRRQRLILWVVFTMGLLPDYDLLFSRFGLAHGTLTHSIVILVPAAILIVIRWGSSLPYMIALIQHVAGDLLMSKYRVFTPLSGAWVGLGIGMGSIT